MEMMYRDLKENFIVKFEHYPDKYKQILIAKERGRVIEVIIAVKGGTRKILSNHLFLKN